MWRDEMLSWDPTQYGGISQIYLPADQIWRPDITLYNEYDLVNHKHVNNIKSMNTFTE